MEKEQDSKADELVGSLKGQKCPGCLKNTLTLTEAKQEVPYFGVLYLFSMSCSNCGYKKSDIEAENKKDPTKYVFEITSEKDMNVRIVKSSEATVKLPHIITIAPGSASDGYVTNIEGLLNRVRSAVESMRNMSEEKDDVKKAKNILKKLQRIMWGQEKLKITITDPSGNSAIIDERAVVSKLKSS